MCKPSCRTRFGTTRLFWTSGRAGPPTFNCGSLKTNTELTREIDRLTIELHNRLLDKPAL